MNLIIDPKSTTVGNVFTRWLAVVVVCLISVTALAQDQTVNGKLDVVAGPIILGRANVWDGIGTWDPNSSNVISADGLSIFFQDNGGPEVGGYNLGAAVINFLSAKPVTTFRWQVTQPDGIGSFYAEDLMSLSSDGLVLSSGSLYVSGGSLLSDGVQSLLPNQTLDGGSASIMTLALSDVRYVKKSSDTLAMGSNATAAGGGLALGANSKAGASAVSIGVSAGSYDLELPPSGASSVSLGHESHGSGTQAVAVGRLSLAEGENAIAIGYETAAQSDNTVAIGRHVVANRWGQIVLGTFNEPSAIASNSAQTDDEIFVIGNGTSSLAKGNALVVTRNGDAQVTGGLKVGGDTIFDEEVTVAKSATFKAGVMVEGTRDVGNLDKVTATPGHEILVPEQGDVSMGDYRAGPKPAQP